MNNRAVNYGVDGVAAGAILGSIMGYLPAIAALAAIVWYSVQIYESKTVQKYVRLRRIRGVRRRLEVMKRTMRAEGTIVIENPNGRAATPE